MDSALAGYLAGGATEALFYGLDSYKTRLQAMPKPGSQRLWPGLFRGIGSSLSFVLEADTFQRSELNAPQHSNYDCFLGPVVAFGMAPSFATFFACYHPSLTLLCETCRMDPAMAAAPAVTGA